VPSGRGDLGCALGVGLTAYPGDLALRAALFRAHRLPVARFGLLDGLDAAQVPDDLAQHLGRVYLHVGHEGRFQRVLGGQNNTRKPLFSRGNEHGQNAVYGAHAPVQGQFAQK